MERPLFYHMGQIRALERVVEILITAAPPQVRSGICHDLAAVQSPDEITDTGLPGDSNIKAENRAYQNGFAETLRQIQKQVSAS